MKVELSASALCDLEEIATYIARDNPRAAEAWVIRLVEQAELAATQPNAGRIVPEFKDSGVREFFLRSYRIIYRIEPERVLILAFVEGHRRLRASFF